MLRPRRHRQWPQDKHAYAHDESSPGPQQVEQQPPDADRRGNADERDGREEQRRPERESRECARSRSLRQAIAESADVEQRPQKASCSAGKRLAGEVSAPRAMLAARPAGLVSTGRGPQRPASRRRRAVSRSASASRSWRACRAMRPSDSQSRCPCARVRHSQITGISSSTIAAWSRGRIRLLPPALDRLVRLDGVSRSSEMALTARVSSAASGSPRVAPPAASRPSTR